MAKAELWSNQSVTDETHSPGRARNPSRQRGRPIRRVALAPGPIEPDRVRGWFAAAGLPPPGDEAALHLANTFSFFKLSFIQAEADATYTAAAREAHGLAVRLIELLPGLRTRHAPAVEQGEVFGAAMARDLAGLARALESARSTLQWRPVAPGHEVRDWRWWAGVARPILAPHLPPGAGLSKGGPLARLLAVIVQDVSGDQVTAVAVWNQLRHGI